MTIELLLLERVRKNGLLYVQDISLYKASMKLLSTLTEIPTCQLRTEWLGQVGGVGGPTGRPEPQIYSELQTQGIAERGYHKFH